MYVCNLENLFSITENNENINVLKTKINFSP